MSVCRLTAAPRSCSGGMYESLPLIWPSFVVCTRPAALATPKSSTRGTPSVPTRTFCGETSRWTMPSGWPRSSFASCAACSPWSTPAMMADRMRSGNRLLPLAERARKPGDGLARHVVHDEEQLAAGRDDVERRHDVRMADARREPRLVEEHRDELGVGRELRVQALDRDRAREADRPEQPPKMDGGHATGRNGAVEGVPAHDAHALRRRAHDSTILAERKGCAAKGAGHFRGAVASLLTSAACVAVSQCRSGRRARGYLAWAAWARACCCCWRICAIARVARSRTASPPCSGTSRAC